MRARGSFQPHALAAVVRSGEALAPGARESEPLAVEHLARELLRGGPWEVELGGPADVLLTTGPTIADSIPVDGMLVLPGESAAILAARRP